MSVLYFIVWIIIFTGSFAGVLGILKTIRKTKKMLKAQELDREMEEKAKDSRTFGIVGLLISPVFIWMASGLIEPAKYLFTE